MEATSVPTIDEWIKKKKKTPWQTHTHTHTHTHTGILLSHKNEIFTLARMNITEKKQTFR